MAYFFTTEGGVMVSLWNIPTNLSRRVAKYGWPSSSITYISASIAAAARGNQKLT